MSNGIVAGPSTSGQGPKKNDSYHGSDRIIFSLFFFSLFLYKLLIFLFLNPHYITRL